MDEKNAIIEENEELKHYGVMGMKWGIRSPETISRYGRANSKTENAKKIAKAALGAGTKAASAALSTIGGKASKVAKNTSSKVSKAREERKLEKKQAKTLNMSRKEFRKTAEEEAVLRRNALESNDPSVVSKGMHLLSDKELKDKYSRLITEKNIREMSPKAKETAKDVVKDIIKSSAKEKLAKPLADEAARYAKNEILKKVAESTGVNPKAAEKTASAVEDAISAYSRTSWSSEGKRRY